MNYNGPPKLRNKSVSFQNDNGDYNQPRPKSYIEPSEIEDVNKTRVVKLLPDANMTISVQNNFKNSHKGKSKNNKHDNSGYDDSSQFLSNLPFIRNNQNNNNARQYESHDDFHIPPRFENQHYQNNTQARGGNSYRGFEKSIPYYGSQNRGGSGNRGRGGNYRGGYSNNYNQDYNDYSMSGAQSPPGSAPNRGRGGLRGNSRGRRSGSRGGYRGRGNRKNNANNSESSKDEEKDPKSPSENEQTWEKSTPEEFRMGPADQTDKCPDQSESKEPAIDSTENEVNKENSNDEFHDVQQDSHETKEPETKEEATEETKSSQNEDITSNNVTDNNLDDTKVLDKQTDSETKPSEDTKTDNSEKIEETSQTDKKEEKSDPENNEQADSIVQTDDSKSTEVKNDEETK